MERHGDEEPAGLGLQFGNTSINGNAHLGNTYVTNVAPSTAPVVGYAACRDALFLTDPVVDREALKTQKGCRTAGTCEWIRDNDSYKAWIAGDISHLWISGGPGKGKTMLSVFLTEEFESHLRTTENAKLLFYFFTHQNEKRNSAAAVFRSLAYQLIIRQPTLARRISDYFEGDGRTQATLSSAEALWIVLKKLLQAPESGTVFCVIDGLDECDDASQRLITSKFRDLFDDNPGFSSGQIRLGIVSRPIAGLETFTQVKLDPDNDDYVGGDIHRFIVSSVGALCPPGFDEDMRKTVEKSLLIRAQGTFLWVGFVMRELSSKATCTEIMETLDTLPSGLPRIYSRMLRQTAPGRRPTISSILRWVTMAFEPMTLRDLAFAIGIQPALPLDMDRTIRDHIALCGDILKLADEKVTLVHQSAKDYLLRAEFDSDPVLELFRIRAGEAHVELTTTCLDCIENGPLSHARTDPRTLTAMGAPPLLGYAVKRWMWHARSSGNHLKWSVLLKRPFFGKMSTTREKWEQALFCLNDGIWEQALSSLNDGEWPSQASPVFFIACNFGILELVRLLLSRKRRYVIGPRDLVAHKNERGETPLIHAICGDRVDVAQLLLKHGANVNVDVYWMCRPQRHLIAAVGTGNTALTRLLLEHGADINAKDWEGSTPLIEAVVLYGELPLCRLLLEHGADVNARDHNGSTALMHLMRTLGHSQALSVGRLLLEHGAEIGLRGRSNYTALQRAIRTGNEVAVRLLLDYGADVNEEYGPKSRGTLSIASDPAILRLLLERGANVHGPAGRQALWLAIRDGNTAVVRVLLEWADSDGEGSDRGGQQPHIS